MGAFLLPDQTRVSQIHLRTGNLARALGFYEGVLGLKVREQTTLGASLSADDTYTPFIVLTEVPGTAPRPPRTVGLYHLAIRYPSRPDLARALRRLARHRQPIEGASDHKVSEAIYLADPDHNGVELYVDRPRSQWVWRQGQVAMTTAALDLDDLLSTAEDAGGEAGAPAGTDLGHIHLQVADLAQAERFYHDYLGLAVMQRSYPGALFLAAGGYHHHLAVNTWAGGAAAPPNSAGVASYRLEVPEPEVLYCLRNRAPLAGYETRTEPSGPDAGVLQIRDPNGQWLQIQSSKAAVSRS